MRYMCAERNKLRRVFSTAIDLVNARGGGKKCQQIDYVLCERALTHNIKFTYNLPQAVRPAAHKVRGAIVPIGDDYLVMSRAT